MVDIPLDIPAIDALIRHWQAKARNPEARISEHFLAEGYVSAYQTVRTIHGLDPLPENGGE